MPQDSTWGSIPLQAASGVIARLFPGRTPTPASHPARANGWRSMRASRAGLAALGPLLLLCWALASAQGRQIVEPEPAGAAARGALLFGSTAGNETDHAAQPRLLQQEVPAEGQQAAGEQQEGDGEDKTIAQVRWCWSQARQHPTQGVLGPAGGCLYLPGAAAAASRCPLNRFEPAHHRYLPNRRCWTRS